MHRRLQSNWSSEVCSSELINQEKNENNSSKHVGIIEKPIEKPIEEPFAIPIDNKAKVKDKKLIVQEQIPLKTAASIRQKARTEIGRASCREREEKTEDKAD